jgi:phage-related protein
MLTDKRIRTRYRKVFVVLSLCATALFLFTIPGAVAQQAKPPQAKPAASGPTKGELWEFDKFLDRNYEMRQDLLKDPKLIDNESYVINHPTLAEFLRNHPGVKSQILRDPEGFVNREKQYRNEHGENVTKGELWEFDKFLDRNYEMRHELVKDPKLIDNESYVINHPTLAEFLRNHPGVKSQILANPEGFMNRERQYDKGQK